MREGSGHPADPSLDDTLAGDDGDAHLDETLAASGQDPSLDETLAAPPGHAAPTGAAALARGATLGRYVVLSLLGRGGMGEVYAAYDPDLDRKVALKVLRPAHARASGESLARARLLREAKAMARLSHPNVISVFDVGTVGSDVYVAMEYVAGGNLRHWLRARPRRWREVVGVFIAAARGLAAAHRHGMIHRDFKPDNVLVGDDGRVRVIDFGLVRNLGDTADPAQAGNGGEASDLTDTTQPGTLLGTPAYMAPEQVVNDPVDARTDQFNFAASLYEALFDVRPFQTESLEDLLHRGAPRPPPETTEVPAWVTRAVLRGLELDPERRFPSMEAMVAALEQPRKRRGKWLALAAAAATLLVAGAVVAMPASDPGEPPCAGLADKLRGVWGDQRRAEVREALVAAGMPEAGWMRVERILDDYSSQWTQASIAACRATAVTKAQSQDMLTRRMACLDRRRRRLDAAVTVLAGGREKIPERAVQIAASLPALDACANTSRLLATPPIAALPAIDDLIAKARALEAAGAYDESETVAGQALKKARAAGSLAHQARALAVLGTAQRQRGEAEKAVETLFAAVRAASRAKTPGIEAQAWVEIVVVTLIGLRHLDEAARWVKHARVAIEAAGGDIALEARLRQGLGHIDFLRERYDEALAHYRAAAALAARAHGDDDWRVAMSLNSAGSTLRRKGQLEEALRAHKQALAVIEAQLGPDHPELTPTLNGLAITLTRLERFEEAKAAYARAIAIHRAARGASHPRLATALLNLGILHKRLGELDRAEALVREALAIREAALPPDHPSIPKARAELADIIRLRKRGNRKSASGSGSVHRAGFPRSRE